MRGYKILGSDYTYTHNNTNVKFSTTDTNSCKYFSYCTDILDCLYHDDLSSDNKYVIVEAVGHYQSDKIKAVDENTPFKFNKIFVDGKYDYEIYCNIVRCETFKIVTTLKRTEFFELVKSEILKLYTPVFPAHIPSLTSDELLQLKEYKKTYENNGCKEWYNKEGEDSYTRYEMHGNNTTPLTCFYRGGDGDKIPFVEYNKKEFKGYGFLRNQKEFYKYTPSGNIQSVYYIHGNVFYKVANYSKYGTLLRVNTYLDNSRYLSSSERYFKNGKLRQRIEYKGDIKTPDGKCTRYYENGKIKQEYDYINGERYNCRSYCKSGKVKYKE